jgi:hypothetical protein
MIAELAMGGLSYQQIGRKCGKTDNNVQQFAWYYKRRSLRNGRGPMRN